MEGKKILLAVTGSIAAYKAAYLVRAIIKKGGSVKVIMTENAKAFISPLTLSTLSKHDVHSDVTDGTSWNNHVDLGLWADLMIVAPATASTIAKMATGMSDNMVTAVYLSAKCPVYVAPAMDRDMWLHPATQNNINTLKSYQNKIIDVADGELASGLIGKGRMAEPDDIVSQLENFFFQREDLKGKKVLITAGPTYEAIDPVRFIGNHSSGKMGVAIAMAAASRGAHVKLILGPSALQVSHPTIQVDRIKSGEEMYNKASSYHEDSDISIFAAAVADYRPITVSKEKIKKKDTTLTIELEKTRDIAKTLGDRKKDHQIHIGFALESTNESEYARKKLDKKNFDFIVLNSLRDKGAGFQVDTNKITIFTNDNEKLDFELKSKKEVAEDIINTIVKKYVNT